MACEINSGDELASTELIFGGVLTQLTPEEAVAVLSALVFQASIKILPTRSVHYHSPAISVSALPLVSICASMSDIRRAEVRQLPFQHYQKPTEQCRPGVPLSHLPSLVFQGRHVTAGPQPLPLPHFPLSSIGQIQGRNFPQQKPRKNGSCNDAHSLPKLASDQVSSPTQLDSSHVGVLCLLSDQIRPSHVRSDQVRSDQHRQASCRHTTDVGSPSVCAADCLTMCVNKRRATWRQLLPHRLSVLLTVSSCLFNRRRATWRQLLPHCLSVLLTFSSRLSTGEERRGGSCCHTSTV